MTNTKLCRRCNHVRPRTEFYPNPKSRGYSSLCKTCQAEYNREHKPSKDKRLAYNRRWYQKRIKDPGFKENKNIKARVYRRILKEKDPIIARAKIFINNLSDRRRAKTDGSLTVESVTRMLRETKNCSCCNRKLQIAGRNPDSASFDRVDNRKGYTAGNVVIVCHECNTKKGNLTLSDIEMIEAYIKRYINV